MLGDAGLLTFHNAAVEAGAAAAPLSYRVAWSRFDNATGDTTPVGNPVDTSATSIQAPAALLANAGSYVRVEISAQASSNPAWAAPVRAYFRRVTGGWHMVGFERSPLGRP